MKRLLFITCMVMLVAGPVWPRPVSYPGGVTLMQMNDADRNSIHLHYSPTARFSIGYKGELWRDEDWQFHGAQLNYLIKRRNRFASQANLYLKSGLGVAYSDSDALEDETEVAAFTGIAVDWETRRWFAAYENRAYYAGDIESFIGQKARVGIAPYIGGYGQLHTWFILQADHNSEKDDGVIVTPLVRLFKSTYMAEIGVNEDSDLLLNMVVRF